MSNITNLNRDYLIKINVKEATIDVPKMTFWNTDKKTSNMFVQLVINMSENELIKNYATIENATDYKIVLNVIKPKTNQYRTFEAKLLNEEKALFEIDLTSEFIDQVGNYNFEFEVSSKVENNDESITTSSSTYEVKGSILTNLNEEISSSPDLPILKQLIEQVKQLQGGDLTDYQKKNDAAQKTIVEDGKLYLTKLDGTKLDDGTTLPTGSGTSIDDTNTTTDKTWSSSKIDSQFKDIANEIKQGKNSLINQNGGGTLKIWAGTQTELDALTSKNSDTLYFIINEESTGGEGTAYTITNTLTNCTNSNIASNIEKNSSYIATISANAGYTLGDVIVTMGGIDITNSSYSNGTINITSVTGNITIVANAELSSTGDKYLTCLSSTALDQYIDTGYTLSSEDEIEVKYSVPNGTVNQEHVIIGARDSWKVNDITLNKNSSGVFGTKTFSGKDSLIYGTTIVIFKVKNGEQSINKTVVANISDTFTCNYSAYIFALNNAGEPYKYSNINLYYLKISKNGVLMKDYRPYIKDGVACLKEEVSGEYLYNLGKESFTYTE